MCMYIEPKRNIRQSSKCVLCWLNHPSAKDIIKPPRVHHSDDKKMLNKRLAFNDSNTRRNSKSTTCEGFSGGPNFKNHQWSNRCSWFDTQRKSRLESNNIIYSNPEIYRTGSILSPCSSDFTKFYLWGLPFIYYNIINTCIYIYICIYIYTYVYIML